MLDLDRSYLFDDEKVFAFNARYADSIIGERFDDYDALEIQGVRNLNDQDDPDGTCCEVDNENSQFISVFAHCKQGGVECVGDFATHLLAEQYANELGAQYGWPINNYVNPRLKLKLVS